MNKIGKLRDRLHGLYQSRWINKYSISAVLFFAWIIFFDKYNLMTQWQLRQTVSQMEESKEEYDELLVQTLIQKEDIEENKERYAREKYFMHRPDEDVFIIERK